MGGDPLPTFSDPFISVTVLAPTTGSSGLADTPCGGAIAASGWYSSALLALKGIFAASASVPAAFTARSSPANSFDLTGGVFGFAAPLTVARVVPAALVACFFAGRFELAIGHQPHLTRQ